MSGIKIGLCACVAASAAWIGLNFARGDDKVEKKERVFEMRTYVAAAGKLDALHARFRDHTNKLFQKHGMELIGYWTPTDGDEAKNTLVYILAYPSREAAKKSWEGFMADADWNKAKAESEKNGKLVDSVKSQYLKPTDYSPIR